MTGVEAPQVFLFSEEPNGFSAPILVDEGKGSFNGADNANDELGDLDRGDDGVLKDDLADEACCEIDNDDLGDDNDEACCESDNDDLGDDNDEACCESDNDDRGDDNAEACGGSDKEGVFMTGDMGDEILGDVDDLDDGFVEEATESFSLL